jgi:hypothetical protein
MFIRWKRRRNLKQEFLPDSLYCVLAKSVRVNGLPRQKIVCNLGHIREVPKNDPRKEAHELNSRVRFWDSTHTRLKAVPMSRAERARIIKSIEAVVRQPTRAQTERVHKETEELFKAFGCNATKRR